MSIQQMMLGNKAGTANSQFIGFMVDAVTGDDIFRGVTFDSAGNMICVGSLRGTNSSTVNFGYVAKFSTTGTILWQKYLTAAFTDIVFWNVAVDTSDNVYACGIGGGGPILAKYNSAGALQWQRRITATGTFFGVCVDSGGNPIVVGDRVNSTHYDALIVKYNSSGTIQWQRGLANAGTAADHFQGVGVDSSDNIYAGGYSSIGDLMIAKYNSSGTIQWQRGNSASATVEVIYGVAVSPTGDVYMGGTVDSNSGDGLIVKYNSSGTIQWAKGQSGGLGFIDRIDGIALDSSGNVYYAGRTNSVGGGNWFIAKVNPSTGVNVWRNTMGKAAAADNAFGIAADAFGSIGIVGQFTTTALDAAYAKVPSDGSKTGTYTVGAYSIVYAATTTGFTNPTPDAAGSATDAATTLTGTTPTYTDSTGAYTTTQTTI